MIGQSGFFILDIAVSLGEGGIWIPNICTKHLESSSGAMVIIVSNGNGDKSIGEENSELRPVELRLKTDFVSYSTWAEGLLNTDSA